MKLAPLATSIAALALLCGCHSTPANPLIGDWTSTVDPGATGAAGCSTRLVFTTDTRVNYWNGQNSTELVTYVVKPDEVFILNQGSSVGYKILSPNTMMLDAGYENCTYKRS